MAIKNTALIVTGAVAVTALAGYTATRFRGEGDVITYRSADVERRDLSKTVSATGLVQPLTVVDIKSRAGGEVKLLAVDVGSVVKPGDLIARIDPTDSLTAFNQAQADVSAAQARVGQSRDTLSLQRQTTSTSIADAEAQVQAAEARLNQAREQSRVQPSLTEAQIRQARASLESAEQTLAQLQGGGNPQAKAEAQAAFASARASLQNAEDNLRRQKQLLVKGFVSQAAVDTAQTQRDLAAAQFESAKTRSETIGPAQEASVRVAQARVSEARANLRTAEAQRVQNRLRVQDVASAEAALAQARSGLRAARANAAQITIRAADIATARAQIARSEAGLRNAQVQLDSTTIRAPRPGVILQKYVEQGTIITSGQSFNSQGTSIVQIGDLSRIMVDANVDEADIAQVKVGQKVKVVLDAFPDDEFEGRVRRIDPRGTTDQNVTVIKTQIEIVKTDPRLKPGLNAECEFVVAEKKDVLVVPSRAVKGRGADRTVQVLVNGKPVTRPVQVGMEGGDAVEILSGVNEGEKVVTATVQPGQNGGGGNNGGGGGGGGQRGPGGLGGGGQQRGPGGLGGGGR